MEAKELPKYFLKLHTTLQKTLSRKEDGLFAVAPDPSEQNSIAAPACGVLGVCPKDR